MRQAKQEEEHTLLKRHIGHGLREVGPDLSLVDLRIVDNHPRLLRQEVANQSDGRRLASITSVGLECEAQYSNFLQGETSAGMSFHTNTEEKRRSSPCR